MPKSVADLCEAQSLSLPDLVEKCGLEPDRVAAIVAGRWTPSPAERAKIADVFGVSTDEIAWGHKTPIQHLWGHGPG